MDFEKIASYLRSEDPEMQDLGVVLFHAENHMYSIQGGNIDIMTYHHSSRVGITWARLRILERRDFYIKNGCYARPDGDK